MNVRRNWRAEAACRGQDTGEWFPARGDPTGRLLAVCHECPVRVDCLEHAVAVPESVGIWGGTSERSRRAMRRILLQASSRGVDPEPPSELLPEPASELLTSDASRRKSQIMNPPSSVA